MNSVLPEVEDGSDKLLEKYLGEDKEHPNKISIYKYSAHIYVRHLNCIFATI